MFDSPFTKKSSSKKIPRIILPGETPQYAAGTASLGDGGKKAKKAKAKADNVRQAQETRAAGDRNVARGGAITVTKTDGKKTSKILKKNVK
jgi:hypothetical protein